MALIEYSFVKTHGEWKLEVYGDVRGIFPSKEAALGAAINAGRAAEKFGFKTKIVTGERQSRATGRRSHAGDRRDSVTTSAQSSES